MKTIKNFLLIVCLFCFQVALAQNNAYSVLASYGKVLIQGSDGKLSPLETGAELLSTDILKVAQDAYLGLIGKNGNTLELNKEGTYKVSDLTGGRGAGSDITQKYAALVLNNMGNASDQSYMYNMSVTGALERSATSNILQAFMPRTTNLLENNVSFSWFTFKDTDEYIFTLSDRYAKKVLQQVVRDTILSLDISTLNLAEENCYYWYVSSKLNPKIKSEEYCIYKLSKNSLAAVRDTLSVLKKDFGSSNTALNSLILASFYEKNNLLNEAMVSYKDAIKKAPQVDEYKKSYALFLIRIGLFDEAKKLWD